MVNIAIFLRLSLFYLLPGVFALYCLVRLLRAREAGTRRRVGIGFVGLMSLLAFFVYNNYRVDKDWEQAHVGTYQLTDYPDCQPCILELQENNLFLVRQHNSIREAGHWRFESGQDYWITYLNENDQLGSGKYSYTKYHLKHSQP